MALSARMVEHMACLGIRAGSCWVRIEYSYVL